MRERYFHTNNKGITLIEIVIVVAVIAVIVLIAGVQFQGMKKKYDVESITKNIYADLMEARYRAFSENNTYGLYWGSSPFNSYELRRDNSNNGNITNGYNISRPVSLENDFKRNGSSSYVKFNEKGTADNYLTIYYDDSSIESEYSCVSVSITRTKMGKWDGSDCKLR